MAILEVSNLKKKYTTRFGGNQVQALKNINFSVKKGEKIAQCIFQKYLTVDNDEATGERTGGFGSTSKN